MSISLSPRLRQRGSRYAIRAGRNLPDKEFRYLRTVIVTAAVYRGFNSELRACALTRPLNLPAPGRRQTLYFVSRDFAESYVFSKQSLPPFLCNPIPPPGVKAFHRAGRTLSQSYSASLPSSLTRGISSA